jgi:hypothetical protein
MLAYLFWHWPRPQVATGDYEVDLIAFHAALAAEPPPGFQRSLTFSVGPLPWLGEPARGYEDWYVVTDSAALDPLDAAAVAGRRKIPHDRAARGAAGGAGGLYRLYGGDLDLTKARTATWLHKPEGLAYADFDAQVRAWIGGQTCCVWQRQMVLGPAREFCILSREVLTLPSAAEALVAVCRTLDGAKKVS